MEPITPAGALERIVYLLERALAPSAKVQAFRRAREVVEAVGSNRLAQLHAAGRLADLAGIGETTAGVIAEALEGQASAYLERLEAETRIPLEEGAELRAELRGDCHSHSHWSDGGATVEAMARAAMSLGHQYLVMTDHSPRLTVAHGLSRDRLLAQLQEIERLNDELHPFRILAGIEVDILEDGALDQDDDLLARLDLVVASVHSKLGMDAELMTRRMVAAVASPHVDVLGHCTGRRILGRGRPQSTFDPEVVFAACARFDTAVEINCRPERQDPPEELLELALEWGCKVAIDSDAHAPGQLEWQAYGCDKAARLGIEPHQIINTWPAEELIDWATGRGGR